MSTNPPPKTLPFPLENLTEFLIWGLMQIAWSLFQRDFLGADRILCDMKSKSVDQPAHWAVAVGAMAIMIAKEENFFSSSVLSLTRDWQSS